MRDKSHEEQVVRWANYVKANPLEWKKQHTLFINSQLALALNFYERLKKTQNGREILNKLRLARV